MKMHGGRGWHGWHGPFPFGGPGFGPWRLPGPWARAGRGDVRAAILFLLEERPMHGYQIIQELSARSGGMWQPSPGSVYPTLQQLEDEGLVRAEEREGRRVFTLTDEGRAEVARRKDEARPWEVRAGAEVGAAVARIREEGFALAGAVMEVVRARDPRLAERAAKVLALARKRMYRLLADEETEETEEGADGS